MRTLVKVRMKYGSKYGGSNDGGSKEMRKEMREETDLQLHRLSNFSIAPTAKSRVKVRVRVR